MYMYLLYSHKVTYVLVYNSLRVKKMFVLKMYLTLYNLKQCEKSVSISY